MDRILMNMKQIAQETKKKDRKYQKSKIWEIRKNRRKMKIQKNQKKDII